MMNDHSEIIFTSTPAAEISRIIAMRNPASTFFIADSNTAPLIAEPMIRQCADSATTALHLISINAGDSNKSLQSLARIWEELSQRGATRHSLIVNVGGGVVTDIGGLAASTFKRGVPFVNVPTTLLSAVDAAVGGKTGINFNGLKNEIGTFAPADAVVISSQFYTTLPHIELCSGYAELLKHSLLDGPESLADVLSYDLDRPDLTRLQSLLRSSVMVKERIVAEDPFEKGLRKALNLGHTAAHAIESLAMQHNSEVAHGIAVAFGLVVDLILSHTIMGFSSETLGSVATFIKEYYPKPQISCSDYPELIRLMRHDKKNTDPDHIIFTLLRSPGEVEINRVATPEQITSALDIARDLLGI